MPLTENAIEPAADAKSDKHKQTILVLVGIAGLGIAWITYRRIASANASQNATAGYPAAQGQPSAGSDTGGGTDWGQINQQLAQISSQEATDVAALTGQETTDIANVQAGQTQQQTLIDRLNDSFSAFQTQVGQSQAPVQGLNASQVNSLLQNGEQVVGQTVNPQGQTLFLTSKGGVYAPNGGFLGSYLGLEPSQQGNLTTNGDFTGGSISIIPGGYELRNKLGQTYMFGTNPGETITK